MSESPPSPGRHRAFWEFLDGKRPAPPAAAMLGWELSWVAPERGEIEVFFDAHEGGGSIAFLGGELRNEAGEVLATATAAARVIRTGPER